MTVELIPQLVGQDGVGGQVLLQAVQATLGHDPARRFSRRSRLDLLVHQK